MSDCWAEQEFQRVLTDPAHSDTAGHLWTLRRYACGCRRIVELGTHDGTATLAFLLGRPARLDTYDLVRHPNVDDLESAAQELGVNFRFHEEDSRYAQIPECDLLFIDTLHQAPQVYAELIQHAGRVSGYILLHDTDTYGFRGDDEAPGIGARGLWEGIGTFLRGHPEWVQSAHFDYCNGLTVLGRRYA